MPHAADADGKWHTHTLNDPVPAVTGPHERKLPFGPSAEPAPLHASACHPATSDGVKPTSLGTVPWPSQASPVPTRMMRSVVGSSVLARSTTRICAASPTKVFSG